MIYEVSLYYDKINAREKPRSGLGQQADQWRVFETEGEAKAFIRLRAAELLNEVERVLRTAKARVYKCERKFAFTLSDAKGVLKQPDAAGGSLKETK